MKSLNNIIALLTLTLYPLVLTLSSTYKNPCTQDTDCSSSSFLQCNKNSFVCDCPKTTLWDHNHSLCMTKEGRTCHQAPSSNTRHPPCISNSSCISSKCQCDDGFLRNGFGICELSYNQPCSPNPSEGLSCAWRYLLECPKGAENPTCKCKGEWVDFIWDENLSKCVSLVGTSCDSEDSWADDKLECVQNALCLNNTCHCSPTHTATPERTCLLKYGAKCDNLEGEVCNKYNLLNCQDGKCGCEFYGQMVYNEEAQQCQMLAGEFCDLLTTTTTSNVPADGIIHKCIPDAECIPPGTGSSHKAKGRCECVQGKLKTPDRFCTSAKGHGLPCSYAGDCDKSQFLICLIDEEHGGRCECHPKEMFYNGTQCLVYPGRSCTENGKCGRNSNCDNGEFCICNEGYLLDPIELNCYLPLERESGGVREVKKEGEEEDALKGLDPIEEVPQGLDEDLEETGGGGSVEEGWISWDDCSGMEEDTLMFRKCKCSLHPESQVWVEEKGKCLGLVGSSCEFNESCVEYAYCNIYDKICECDGSKAKMSLDKICVLRRGNIGHQPWHGDPGQHFLDDGSEKNRMNPRAMAASSGEVLSQSVFRVGVGFLVFSYYYQGTVLVV